ncbi:MAG: FecR family protein [Candidatus Cyclobacteriaceae bacterium M3_2C_046]
MNPKKIRKFFKEGNSVKESAHFLKWLSSATSIKEISDYMDQAWQELEEHSEENTTVLNRIHHKIDHQQKYIHRKKSPKFPFYKLAAVVLIILTAGISLYLFDPFQPQEIPQTVIEIPTIYKSTQPGQKLTVRLPDKSMVMLHADSEISYPAVFSDSIRVVDFQGEAFFEVQETNKPFIVRTNNLTTSVLGTSFNVRYRNDENQIQVALLSGSVVIQQDQGSSITLTPGDLLIYDQGQAVFNKRKLDYKKHIGWKEGIICFNHDTLSEIKEKLELWYGVNITIKGQVSNSRHFKGDFQNATLENVLESLSFTFDFMYNIDENNVLIEF